MKEDVAELPSIPRKRSALKKALDLHLALWLERDDLMPSVRRALQEEKQRRKSGIRELAVGVLVGFEGATPAQLRVLREEVGREGVTRVFAPRPMPLGLAPDVFRSVASEAWDDRLRGIVRACDSLLAAPRDHREPTKKDSGVWAMVRYARHRKVPVKVVLPDGAIMEGEQRG
jgi:hypothetical protein